MKSVPRTPIWRSSPGVKGSRLVTRIRRPGTNSRRYRQTAVARRRPALLTTVSEAVKVLQVTKSLRVSDAAMRAS